VSFLNQRRPAYGIFFPVCLLPTEERLHKFVYDTEGPSITPHKRAQLPKAIFLRSHEQGHWRSAEKMGRRRKSAQRRVDAEVGQYGDGTSDRDPARRTERCAEGSRFNTEEARQDARSPARERRGDSRIG
jgi:hypothetical protein